MPNAHTYVQSGREKGTGRDSGGNKSILLLSPSVSRLVTLSLAGENEGSERISRIVYFPS